MEMRAILERDDGWALEGGGVMQTLSGQMRIFQSRLMRNTFQWKLLEEN